MVSEGASAGFGLHPDRPCAQPKKLPGSTRLSLAHFAALNFIFGATTNYWGHLVLWTLNGFVQGMG